MFDSLGELKMKWAKFLSSGQELLVSTLMKQLPRMTDDDRFFALQGLIGLQPNFERLPTEIQQYFFQSCLKEIHSSTNNGFCITINRFDIEYKFIF